MAAADLAEAVAAPIAQLQSMLGPDGYELRWQPTGDAEIALEVVAGDDACADCLVPKPVMLEIVNRMLGEVGVRAVELVYPVDGKHHPGTEGS